MLRNLGLFLVVLMMSACGGPRYVDFFPCYDDGLPKPRVALLPVHDSTSDEKGVSQVIEEQIRLIAMHHGDLYLIGNDAYDTRRFEGTDLFGSDLSFARQSCGAQYLVAVEIVENKFNASHTSATIKARLRIIDLRYATPLIVLQEVVCHQRGFPGKGQRQASQELANSLVSRIENALWGIH